jgi:hypothetical protein
VRLLRGPSRRAAVRGREAATAPASIQNGRVK